MNQKAMCISSLRNSEGYGKLSDQRIELEMGASNRTASEDDAKKRNPLDFALWKAQNQVRISWNSPWGKDAQDGILNAR